MENEQFVNSENEIYEKNIKFIQTITRDDIIHFNDYLLDRRAKNSIFNKIIGVFFVILGIVGLVEYFTQNDYNIFGMVVDGLTVIIGILFIFVLGPLTVRLQKKTIRKKIGENFKNMVMKVTVHNEGIGFEMVDESQPEEVIETTAVENDELTNEQARELEYEEVSDVEEVEATIVEEDNAVVEQEEVNDDPNNPNVFTIPWGGITRIDDDGEFMFINMIGYQALLIKKADYNEIEEVVEFAKEMLQDSKRYAEINSKTK